MEWSRLVVAVVEAVTVVVVIAVGKLNEKNERAVFIRRSEIVDVSS